MLQASETLAGTYNNKQELIPETSFDNDLFKRRGEVLCRQVYAKNYDPLRAKITAFAPEVFQWMLLEGYGKVLAREELPIGKRELSIVTFLMMENRYKQLYSHLMGALNVGVEIELITSLVKDFGNIAPEGYSSALAILEEIGTR